MRTDMPNRQFVASAPGSVLEVSAMSKTVVFGSANYAISSPPERVGQRQPCELFYRMNGLS